MIKGFYNPCKECGCPVIVLADDPVPGRNMVFVRCLNCGEYRHQDLWNKLNPALEPTS